MKMVLWCINCPRLFCTLSVNMDSIDILTPIQMERTIATLLLTVERRNNNNRGYQEKRLKKIHIYLCVALH